MMQIHARVLLLIKSEKNNFQSFFCQQKSIKKSFYQQKLIENYFCQQNIIQKLFFSTKN